MIPFDPTADGWAAEAKSYLDAARTLQSTLPRQAYVQAATAVECAIKCLIMRRKRLNRWPTKAERRDYHTHDFEALARHAGILADINSEIILVTDVGVAWVVANQFSVAHRYPDQPLSRQVVVDMIEASERLVPWLLNS